MISGKCELTWRWEARHTARRHPHRRPSHTHSAHASHGPSRKAAAQIGLIQRIRLSLRVVRVRYTINNLLCLVAGYLLVVRLHVAEVVAAIVVSFPHAHTIVSEVDIAVVTEELRHLVALRFVRGWWVVAQLTKADGVQARRQSSELEREESRDRRFQFQLPMVLAQPFLKFPHPSSRHTEFKSLSPLSVLMSSGYNSERLL
jgi:hypothetical protein